MQTGSAWLSGLGGVVFKAPGELQNDFVPPAGRHPSPPAMLRGVPRGWKSGRTRGGGSRGEHAKLISAISLLHTTLAGSHLAPPRQKQPLCLASGSWLGSERAPCPIPFPPLGEACRRGGTWASWQGVLPATGCQKPRWAWKVTRALPGKEASPRLIAPLAIKAGRARDLPAGSRCCPPSAPGWD